jgi:hypothetical protein
MVTYTEEIRTLGLLIITLFMNWSVIIIKTCNKLLTLREHLGSLPVSGRVRIAHVFSFLCCVSGRVRIAHVFSFLCCVSGRVRIAHVFSFLCCVSGRVRISHVFSILCCVFVLCVFVLCLV